MNPPQQPPDAAIPLPEPVSGAPQPTIRLSFTANHESGDQIGRYKLLQQIGEGGCGVVYMAEQEEPVRRRVALKVIKLGMDTKQVIARFEAERQALALMDHPNIAKVLDAGATEAGRPFFVMELVRGVKITEYCDQNKLSTEARLELFVQVCHAIQHAHQKGVIHRDIKPSNILVTLHDGAPVPKVIDFGIAKATQGRLTDQTLFTAFEQFIGTPAYMSPEQAEMSGLDIDTRSDIYALGVLLYELLTSRTPFDSKELIACGLDKMRLMIREQEPLSPSTRLSTMVQDDLTTTAKCRCTEAPKLIHLLRGDLDWIVMKALEKDRTRRFDTATALAHDVQRHLHNEPVTARPPTALYRFQKLVRRNKLAFAAAAAVIAALVAGLAVSTTLFIREREARKRADAAERTQATLRQEAEAGRAAEAKLREQAEVGKKYSDAGLLLSQGRFDEAQAIVNPLPRYPASAAIFNVLAQVRAQRGQWQQAITNYEIVLGLMPADHSPYHALAALLASSGDVAGYNRLRQSMLKRFGDTSDPIVAERTAKDCCIFPPTPADLPAIGRLADIAVTAGAGHKAWPYFQFVKGLVEYRQGHYTNALEWLEQVSTRAGDPARALQARMTQAMAQQQLRQTDAARSTLRDGLQFADAQFPKPEKGFGDLWNDWLIAQILMREAKALIDPGQPP